MELNEIKKRLAELKNSASELADECYLLRARTANQHLFEVAEYLHYELTSISSKLIDLSDVEEEDNRVLTESESADADAMDEWWHDLSLLDKCEFANIPYPTNPYERGDDYDYAQERANNWWYSRTFDQQKELYTDHEDL